MKPASPCILLVLLCGFISHAQTNKTLDSLLQVYNRQAEDTTKVNTLKHLFDQYLNNDLERAEKYAEEEMELSRKLGYKKGIGLAYLHFGVLHEYRSHFDSAKTAYSQARDRFRELEHRGLEAVAIRNMAGTEYALGNYDESMEILDEGIETLLQHSEDPVGLIPFYHNKGLIHSFKGNYKLATQEAIKELKILEKVDRPIAKADALNLLASIEMARENHQKGIEYNLQALEIYREFNDKFFEVNVLNDIGLGHYSLENYKEAIQYLEQALEINETVKNQSLESTILTNLGKAYARSDRPAEGVRSIRKGIETAERIGAKNKRVEGYNALASVYGRSDQLDSAIAYYSRSISLIDSGDSKSNLSNAYEARAALYARTGNYQLAYRDHVNHKKLSDSLYNIRKSQQIEELQTIYETEKKEQELALKEKEIAVLEQEAQISYQQKLLLGGGLGLSLVALGFGFYGFRQKVKSSRLEKEKLDAELAFKKKELTTHALHLAKKNEVLESLKVKARALKKKEGVPGYQELIKTINFDQQDDQNWERFTQYFEQVHKDFATNVKKSYPEVTKNELRLMALLKMNLSSKEIASMLNISNAGVKKARNRLRKKLGMAPEESLEARVLAM